MDDLFEQVRKSLDGSQQQVAAAEKAIREFSEANRKDADAINQQVAALQKLAASVINWQTALDRPWVGIETVTATPLVANQPFTLKAVIRNSGRSPALNVRAFVYTAVRAVKDTPDPHIAECNSCAQTVILPNAVFNYDLSVGIDVLTQEKSTTLKAAPRLFFYWAGSTTPMR